MIVGAGVGVRLTAEEGAGVWLAVGESVAELERTGVVVGVTETDGPVLAVGETCEDEGIFWERNKTVTTRITATALRVMMSFVFIVENYGKTGYSPGESPPLNCSGRAPARPAFIFSGNSPKGRYIQSKLRGTVRRGKAPHPQKRGTDAVYI